MLIWHLRSSSALLAVKQAQQGRHWVGLDDLLPHLDSTLCRKRCKESSVQARMQGATPEAIMEARAWRRMSPKKAWQRQAGR